MRPIQTLLDEISKRISITSSLITELKKKQNMVLLIENTLFKYNLKPNDLNIDNIILLSEDDLKVILNEIGHANIDKEIKSFKKNKDIIKLYQKVTSDSKSKNKPSQYKKAKEELNNLIKSIKDFIKTDENEKIEHIEILENNLSSYKTTQDKFKSGELKEPIFDVLEFNASLNKYGLDTATKVAIKKEIGKQNYNLVMEPKKSRSDDEKALDKYRIILERKKEEYKEDLEEVKELFLSKNFNINIDNTLTVINDFFKMVDKPYNLVQNAVVSLMIEKELKEFDKLISSGKLSDEKRDEIIINCEKLLVISRRKEPKEQKEEMLETQKPKEIKVEKTKEEVHEEKVVKDSKDKETEDQKLIRQIEDIIAEEIDVLNNYSENDTTRLTELSTLLDKYALEDESIEKNILTSAFLAETLRLNLIFFKQLIKNYEKSPKEYELDYKKKVGELRDYISTYEIVKARIKKYNEKEIKKNNK